MAYVSGVDRQQTMLLPESLEQYVGSEHPVRFIDAFVEGLDLQACRFERSVAAATGRPPYSPGDLLKLYLWGYLNSVQSSRKLERECGRNLEVLWLMRKLAPDFKTIADFRKDNPKALKAVFRQFGLLCRQLGLWGSELVAIDGTKLKAVNSISRNHTRAELQEWLQRLDARVESYLQQLDCADGQLEMSELEAGAGPLPEKLKALQSRREEVSQMLAELEQSGAKEISRTDPDSRRMSKVGVGYNGQIAVDERHKLIVEAEVVNAKNDCNEFFTMAQAACESMGLEVSQPKLTADRGYHDRQVLAEAEAAGMQCYVPQPLRGHAASEGHYPKRAFIYDASTDQYTCPIGTVLGRETQTIKHGVMTYLYSNASACRQCLHRDKCTDADYRRIDRWENEAVVEEIAKRVAANPQIIRRRSALVEHPFGTIKFWMNQRAFLTRGLERVRTEWRLSALAYNIKRVINIVGVGPLLAKLRGRKNFQSASTHSSPSRRRPSVVSAVLPIRFTAIFSHLSTTVAFAR
jgi:transposase